MSVNCLNGKVAIGGGGNGGTQGGSDRFLRGSYPVMSGSTAIGWTARFDGGTNQGSVNTVYVICANP